MNITARKTATLQGLVRQVNEASTIVSEATAKYESFSNKASAFQTLFTQRTNDLAVAENRWQLFLALKSSLLALKDTASSSNEVAVVSYNAIRKMIRKWENVMTHTLEAADAINLASDLINKRKAVNPIISNDLVNDAKIAAANAVTVVKQVIDALTAALNSLSSSNKANNTTELTEMYIDIAISVLLSDKRGDVASVEGLQDLVMSPEAAHKPLEDSLNRDLQEARKKMNDARTASNKAAKEMATAKEELDTANALLATSQMALSAAQGAVA